ncbi:MAG: glycosyltransferase family 4 protein [Bacteroidia bacterium]
MTFQKREKAVLPHIVAGTNSLGYPQRRNFVSLPFKKYRFKKYYDLYSVMERVYYRLSHRSSYYFLNTFNDFGLQSAPFFHFFNTISFGKKPWLTTFETDLPRWGDFVSVKKAERAIRALAGSDCKAIIAISESTAAHQRARMDKYYSSYKDALYSKMQILHPPQALCVKEYGLKKLDSDYITFTLVGNELFTKGGREVLRVFDRLLEKKMSVKLHIVSGFEYGDYATKSTVDDVTEAVRITAKYPENIFRHSQLPNVKVLELLNLSHIGILTSWADTYGYSVLEAQASGCPVITTNVRALPEINDADAGWVIPVPVNSLGDALCITPEERKKFSDLLTEQLYIVIKDIIDNPAQIETKGKKSIERIVKFHNPEDCAERLEKIYDLILAVGS